MPHPNELLIQQLFDAYGRGDTAALRLQLAPDVEYELPGHSPMSGTYRGREEVLALWDRQKAYLGGKPYLVTRDGSVADDDGLVLLAAGEAEGPAGTLRWRAANVYRIRDAQVAGCRVFVDDLYTFDVFWARMPTAGHASGPVAVARRWVQSLTDHDLDAAVECFEDGYADEAPARRGESVQGRDAVRRNFQRLFADIPDLAAELLRTVVDGHQLWMEWRMRGTRRDATEMEFVGVNIFEVEGERFRSGRIYTELVRDAGGIDAQTERMTRGGVMQPNGADQPEV